jgi:hypothetical protein
VKQKAVSRNLVGVNRTNRFWFTDFWFREVRVWSERGTPLLK